MSLLDRQYTDTPYDGVRRMTAWLCSQGYHVNHKRVARLMHTMGLEATSPQPRLSQTHPTHRVYPSLLRRGADYTGKSSLEYRYHLYSTARGGIYLVAVMDWFSRYVLSWAVSITMDVGFCLEALD